MSKASQRLLSDPKFKGLRDDMAAWRKCVALGPCLLDPCARMPLDSSLAAWIGTQPRLSSAT